MDHIIGTDDAVSAAIEKYSDMVRRICFLYLRERADVDDVFQEVFLKFFLHADTFQSEQHEKAWLCRVTFNKCKDVCKSFWRKKVVSLEDADIPYESPDQGDLISAIVTLPLDNRELIYLHYYEGRSVPEIAGMLNKNENTIYSKLRRAKERLRQKVGEI